MNVRPIIQIVECLVKGVTLLKEINAKLVLMKVFLGVKDVTREP